MRMGLTQVSRTLALAIGLLALTSCGPGKQEALNFNETLVGTNKRLTDAGHRVGTAIGAHLQGTSADTTELKAARDNMNTVMSQIRQEMSVLKVPEVEDAQAFYDAHQKYLETQEKTLAKIAKLVNDMLANSITKEQIIATVQEFSKGDEQDLIALQTTQKAFAAKHGITLK